MTCGACGATNTPDAAFCAKCGKSVRAPAFCSRCATPVGVDAEFCSKCGKRHGEDDPPRLTPAVMPPHPPPMMQMQPQMMMRIPTGCPRCGAPFTSHTTVAAIVICIVLFPIGLIALAMPKEHRCVNPSCRWRW